MFDHFLSALREHKALWKSAACLIIAGIIHPYAALAVLPLLCLHLSSKKNDSDLFILFFITLILSDSRSIIFRFAHTIKPFFAIFLCLIIFSQKKHFKAKNKTFLCFIPFFFIAFYAIQNNPNPSNSLLKAISYCLLLFVVPIFVKALWQSAPEKLLKTTLLSGQIILVLGLLARLVYPNLATLAGRYRGLLGNPNGLGIYCTLFFILSYCIWFYHKQLMTKRIWLMHFAMIGFSILLSASRNALLSCLLFAFMAIILRKSRVLQILTILFAIFLLPLLKIYFVELVLENDLGEFFRISSVEDLEKGSGRAIAFEFAWQWIQDHYWEGQGFGFTEYLFKEHSERLRLLGHVGNAHNSFLTIWIDTGFIGLICFIAAWSWSFIKASSKSDLALPAYLAICFSCTFESWLAASLNPFTIQALIILTLLSQKSFISKQNHEKTTLPLH
ncbi:O-antigen ligase family protein [Lentisphaera profundi]|uniref:O-antigen ligase family protein n=1 Tax=Lentisphaera profundi TaxID=1658616 RepID=A0ABY7W1Q7_9BACT|nr:O-antigen ligase family protein [Lentisphaera profundi]WDE98203.1 O-antigen ligase family protein [Lentisphaera profundi]